MYVQCYIVFIGNQALRQEFGSMKTQFQKNWEKKSKIINIERTLNLLSHINTSQSGSALDIAYDLVFQDLVEKLLQLNNKDLDNE